MDATALRARSGCRAGLGSLLPDRGRASQPLLEADAFALGQPFRATVVFPNALAVSALAGPDLPDRFPVAVAATAWTRGSPGNPAGGGISRRRTAGFWLRELCALSHPRVVWHERRLSAVSSGR